ncbi:MAG TPA: ABC transporter permease [Acidobacteriaceae bacterium]|nr:ABC transporter permease [Acidobacteriaceae bacterium]
MATPAIAAPQPLSLGYYTRIFGKETRYEFVRMLRTRAFSLSVIGFPIMFFLLIGVSNRHNGFGAYLVPGYSCMGVVSACLFGIGVSISLDRNLGWLDLKQASPMPRLAYIGAKLMSCAAFALIIVAGLISLGVTVGGAHITLVQAARLAGVVLAGSIPFAAMGLVVALTVPPNSGPGIINLIWLPMSFVSGFWMPVTLLPHIAQKIALALPTYHLAQLALGIFGMAQPGSSNMVHWEFLAGFTLLMLGAAWIIFSRIETKQ